MIPILRDYREERNWQRPWLDRPGWFRCCCASSVDGYVVGGSGGTNTAEGISFTSETCSYVTTANLNASRYEIPAGISDSTTAGYWLGGNIEGATNVAEKTTFSSDTTTSVTTANLTSNRSAPTAVSERSTKGYCAGGYTNLATDVVVTADKLVFSTETTSASASADLSQAREHAGSVGDGSTKGYFAGGFTNSGRVATADKIVFSTDTTSATASADLSAARSGASGLSDGTAIGFWAGGLNTATTRVVTADKITFSTDTTTAATSADLSSGRYATGAQSAGSVKGFWLGGQNTTPAAVVTADKITFATETTAAATTADLNTARQSHGSMSQTGL